jgi:Golgi nucleoside diphosphatase
MSQTTSIEEIQQSEISSSNIELIPIPSRPSPTVSNLNSRGVLEEPIFIRPLNTEANTIPRISRWQTSVIIGTVATATLLNSLLTGLLVVGLPTMAKDLSLDSNLLLWPASVSA